jgi:hypothetical protein
MLLSIQHVLRPPPPSFILLIIYSMKKYGVYVMIVGLLLSIPVSLGSSVVHAAITNAPTFGKDLETHLLEDPTGKGETIYSPSSFKVSANNSLKQNIYNLVSPGNDSSVLWVAIRTIMIGVLMLHFARSGIILILNADDEKKRKEALRSFYYMVFGAFLIYGVTWILGKALAIETVAGSS